MSYVLRCACCQTVSVQATLQQEQHLIKKMTLLNKAGPARYAWTKPSDVAGAAALLALLVSAHSVHIYVHLHNVFKRRAVHIPSTAVCVAERQLNQTATVGKST